MSKSTGLVLSEQIYRGPEEPPAAFKDDSRYGNDGVHTAITWVQLPSGVWVRDCNGSNSNVAFSTSASLDGNFFKDKAFTISFWFNSDVLGNDDIFSGRTYDPRIYINSNDLYYSAYVATSHTNILNASMALVADTWYYATVLSDLTNDKMYVNAAVKDSQATTSIDGGATSYDFGDSQWAGREFGGMLAALQIYNRALSEQEIIDRYESTRHIFGV